MHDPKREHGSRDADIDRNRGSEIVPVAPRKRMIENTSRVLWLNESSTRTLSSLRCSIHVLAARKVYLENSDLFSKSLSIFHVVFKILSAISIPARINKDRRKSNAGSNVTAAAATATETVEISETSFSGSNIGAVPRVAYFRWDLVVWRQRSASVSTKSGPTARSSGLGTAIGELGRDSTEQLHPKFVLLIRRLVPSPYE